MGLVATDRNPLWLGAPAAWGAFRGRAGMAIRGCPRRVGLRFPPGCGVVPVRGTGTPLRSAAGATRDPWGACRRHPSSGDDPQSGVRRTRRRLAQCRAAGRAGRRGVGPSHRPRAGGRGDLPGARGDPAGAVGPRGLRTGDRTSAVAGSAGASPATSPADRRRTSDRSHAASAFTAFGAPFQPGPSAPRGSPRTPSADISRGSSPAAAGPRRRSRGADRRATCAREPTRAGIPKGPGVASMA